jgi:hypothetical protein
MPKKSLTQTTQMSLPRGEAMEFLLGGAEWPGKSPTLLKTILTRSATWHMPPAGCAPTPEGFKIQNCRFMKGKAPARSRAVKINVCAAKPDSLARHCLQGKTSDANLIRSAPPTLAFRHG